MPLHFADRMQAGKRLARRLMAYRRNPNAMVFAVPRGGVITGYEVAQELEIPLELVFARKIADPEYPEFAVSAVSESGPPLREGPALGWMSEAWFTEALARERREILRSKAAFHVAAASPSACDRIAIVVDDGIATGYTLRAALQLLRAQNAKRLIAAAPVAPRPAVEYLRAYADDVVVLEDAEEFLGCVAAYYDDFHPATNEEIIALLKLSGNFEAQMPTGYAHAN